MGIDDDDMSTNGMQCSDHPFRNTSPGGGICAFCLQEKLGKLVSSSSSSFFIPSPSCSPSLRSDTIHPSIAPPIPAPVPARGPGPIPTSSNNNLSNNITTTTTHFQRGGGNGYPSYKKTRIPFLLTHKMKKIVSSSTTNNTNSSETRNMVLKRSKSTATPRSSRYLSNEYNDDFSPRRRGFWSFLHLSNNGSNSKKVDNNTKSSSKQTPIPSTTAKPHPPSLTVVSSVDETYDSPNSSGTNESFGCKVSRSRYVGCGSRSFFGDFFERISIGFGDCTLRLVESQREGTKHRHSTSRTSDTIREKVRCGGLFGGFIITSSSTSSSSSYWTADGPPSGPSATPGTGSLIHGRSRSWGWAFASPMRAFTKPTTTTTTIKEGKRKLGGGGTDSKNSNGTPNLAAIPSLLAVRS